MQKTAPNNTAKHHKKPHENRATNGRAEKIQKKYKNSPNQHHKKPHKNTAPNGRLYNLQKTDAKTTPKTPQQIIKDIAPNGRPENLQKKEWEKQRQTTPQKNHMKIQPLTGAQKIYKKKNAKHARKHSTKEFHKKNSP